MTIETIIDDEGTKLATVVRAVIERDNGVTFVTEPQEPLQVATMRHPSGHVVPAHSHKSRNSAVFSTNECLVVMTGRVDVTVYDRRRKVAAESVVLRAGDVVIFFAGGHRLRVLEDAAIVETKQGPYLGRAEDKIEVVDTHTSWQ